jgi:hypothetical protein
MEGEDEEEAEEEEEAQATLPPSKKHKQNAQNNKCIKFSAMMKAGSSKQRMC